jgi:hypothetical protein
MLPLEKFIGHLKDVANTIPDPRVGKNSMNSLVDIVCSAFAIFLFQCPSWLNFQRTFASIHFSSNMKTLFGVSDIPTDNHIRNILDKIKCTVFNVLFYIIINYYQQTYGFKTFEVMPNRYLVAVDGSDYFNSRKINCDNCSTKYHKTDNEYEYHHTITGMVICSPNTSDVLPLPPVFVSPKESNNNKQDTECKSFKRYLNTSYDKISYLNPIFLLDAIYGNQPMIISIKEHNNCNYIITCKPGSQANVFDFVNGATLDTLTCIHQDGYKKFIHEYRWMTNVPLNGQKNSILVNYIELKETEILTKDQIKRANDKLSKRSKNKSYTPKVSFFTYITDLIPTENNIKLLIKSGRTRWCIENGFNSLKKRGYNFEHNFGHGKNNLSYVLITLMLLAFLFNTVSLSCCKLHKAARDTASSFQSFSLDIAYITKHLIFNSFEHLFKVLYYDCYGKEYIDSS